MLTKIFLVDAMVQGPFTGAPTTVVFLESPMDKFKMLSLANEMGTSQTVYVLLHSQAAYLLRFFSRAQELPMGVHASHAAAHLIFELGLLPPDEKIEFLTQESALIAKRVPSEQTEIGFSPISMNKMDSANLNAYAEVLSINPKAITWAGVTPNRAAILFIDSTVPIRRLVPDREKLHKTGAAVLCVTSPDQSGGDYALRCFTPNLLLPEHQVSGNIHRCLAPRWARTLGKKHLIAHQYSNRGALVRLEVSDPNQVLMTAKSLTILRSDLVAELQDSLASLAR
ncbi:MAG: PhzF family phenazine biosynthesis protein [Deltaproteobacteria bacterium]|jgi:PhzF family phenazine biosynthesis protein|nr:PhzF family phenazine biosynthesis protein [Deltaproteobacteria bacterium]